MLASPRRRSAGSHQILAERAEKWRLEILIGRERASEGGQESGGLGGGGAGSTGAVICLVLALGLVNGFDLCGAANSSGALAETTGVAGVACVLTPVAPDGTPSPSGGPHHASLHCWGEGRTQPEDLLPV